MADNTENKKNVHGLPNVSRIETGKHIPALGQQIGNKVNLADLSSSEIAEQIELLKRAQFEAAIQQNNIANMMETARKDALGVANENSYKDLGAIFTTLAEDQNAFNQWKTAVINFWKNKEGIDVVFSLDKQFRYQCMEGIWPSAIPDFAMMWNKRKETDRDTIGGVKFNQYLLFFRRSRQTAAQTARTNDPLKFHEGIAVLVYDAKVCTQAEASQALSRRYDATRVKRIETKALEYAKSMKWYDVKDATSAALPNEQKTEQKPASGQ